MPLGITPCSFVTATLMSKKALSIVNNYVKSAKLGHHCTQCQELDVGSTAPAHPPAIN